MAIVPSPHVRVTIVSGDLVLLDLDSDAYLALPRKDAAQATSALTGHPYDPGDAALEELMEAAMVQHSETAWEGHKAHPVMALPQPLEPSYLRKIWMLLPFSLATLMTIMSYRQPIHQLIQRLKQPRNARVLSPQYVGGIVQWFERLRILVPRSGRCLIQSIMLCHFLRLLGVPTQLVFGVRTHPFEAHCWVEWDRHVLNDSIDHAGWYSTIARF